MGKVFIVMIVLLLASCTPEKSVEKKEVSAGATPVEFLSNYYSNINLKSNSFSDLKLLNEDLHNHRVFLTGETHAVHLNLPVQLKLLKYLNQKAGVRYYLDEHPYSYTAWVNRYLETGEEKIIDYLAGEAKGTASEAKDGFDLVKEVYDYNKTLPKSKRIKFIGMDADTSLNMAFSYLIELMRGKQISRGLVAEKLPSMIQPGTTFRDQHNPKTDGFAAELASDLKTNESKYRTMLGKDFEEFSFIVSNIGRGVETVKALGVSLGEWNVAREQVFKTNFIYWSNVLGEDARYFGEWGREHVYLSMVKYDDPDNSYASQIPHFAQVINEEVPATKGKVLSIALSYNKSSLFDPGAESESRDFQDDLQQLNMLTEHAKDHPATLYKLDGKNSPFLERTFFLTNGTKQGTINYFQYILLIQGSDASRSYFE